MIPYILVAVFLLVLAVHFDINGNLKNRDLYLNIATWVLILFSGLRNELGIDTYSYANTFYSAPSLLQLFSKGFNWLDLASQPLWLLLMSTCKSIAESFILFQMIIAVVFNLLMVRFFKATSKSVFICLFVFFCTKWHVYNFEILRESLCVVLLLNAVAEYANTQDTKRYFLYSIAAIFIHWFALIMVLLFFIMCKTNTKLVIAGPILLGAIVFMADREAIEFFMFFTIEQLDSSNEKLNTYLVQFTDRNYNLFYFFRLLIIYAIPILIVLKYYLSIKKNSSISELVLVKFVPLYFIIEIYSTELTIAYRLTNYVYPIYLVVILNTLSESIFNRRSVKKIVRYRPLMNALLLCFLISIYFNVMAFIEPNRTYQERGKYDIRYFPYTSVFQEQNSERNIYYSSWRNWQNR